MFRIHSALSRQRCQLDILRELRMCTHVHTGRSKSKHESWSEKLQSDEKYPLTLALNAAIQPVLSRLSDSSLKGPVSKVVSKGPHVRTQIVNPALCDDVLKYVGPILEKHKGCDILDINPGSGLWSQKLHEFLQPRSHILLEPGYEIFKSFLDPLLMSFKSKYKLVEGDPCSIDTYRTMIDDGVFSHQVPLDPQEPRTRETNNTLLVTGSLVWDPKLPGLSFDSMAKQLFHHFAAAAPANDAFHAFGSVRTLLWVQNDDFSPVIAESIAGMQKANRFLEMISQISVLVQASATVRRAGRGSHGREPQYEIESTIKAIRNGRKNGMELPRHRRDHIHDYAEELEKVSGGTDLRSFFLHDYLHSKALAGKPTTGLLQEAFLEHYEHEKKLRDEHPDIAWDQVKFSSSGGAPGWNLRTHPAKQEVSRLFRRRAGVAMILRIKEKIETTADIGERLYALECKILETPDGKKKERMMKELEDLDKQWEFGVENAAVNYGSALLTEIDDRLALRSPPQPRLQWDCRQFEPLVMSPTEVWPHNRLALILSEPIPQDSSKDPDWLDWVQDFVFGLFPMSHASVIEGLDKMQHGLSDIIKDCPTLKIPKKGGRLQMRHLRVRMLTVEMIDELVTAYRKWPFKAPGSDHSKYFRIKGSRSRPAKNI